MHRVAHGILEVALVATAALAVLPAAGHAQVACGDVIPAKAKVTLTSDIGPCAAASGNPAITVESGATLDMNGHRLECDTGDRPDGIHLRGKGTKLLNGLVSLCNDGVSMMDDGSHKITNVTARFGLGSGFVATSGADKNKLTGTEALGNVSNGYHLASDKNKLKQTSASDNEDDGYIVLGDGNKISESAASGNFDDGFDLDGDKNKLEKSLAMLGYIETPDTDGVDVAGDGNTIKDVRAIGNPGDGIRLETSAEKTKIQKCVALENGEFDAEDMGNAACNVDNKWSKNVFGTTKAGPETGPACIE